ncbi:uncharacterized protein METZ01_LOCUS194262 [marine metagenome]|uniref:Uncharacterized protein n=1 Tax=marine metagenome TaxID=408172 RepID=A0A382DSP9_9ZZZZ
MTRKKNHFFLLLGLTFPDFSGIIFEVSERKTMNLFKKNQMTLKEIERFMDAKRKREARARAGVKKVEKNSFLDLTFR